jgi:hypothetical protein
MPEFSTNALRNRAGPIERTPGGGFAGGGCEKCECVETFGRFYDDFFSMVTSPGPPIFSSEIWEQNLGTGPTVSNVARSRGWAKISANVANVVSIGLFRTRADTFGIPPSPNENLKMKVKVFIHPVAEVQDGGTVQVGFEDGGDGRRFNFFARPGVILATNFWAVETFDGVTLTQAPTFVEFATECEEAQILEIEGAPDFIKFFINGVLVATLPTPPDIFSDNFRHIYRVDRGDLNLLEMETDYSCITMGNDCVLKLN